MSFEVILEQFDNSSLSYWSIKKISTNKKRKEYTKNIKSYRLSSEKKEIQTISGILNVHSMDEYINRLIPGSFGLRYKFELITPYFSRDDDEFYIIDNPVMKEKVWKVPIIKGSSWKGALLKAARRKMNVLIEKGSVKDVLDNYLSITRIFGTGSDEYRKIEDEIKKFINEKEKKNESILMKQLVRYALSDLGLNLNIKMNGKTVAEQILEQIIEYSKKSFNIESPSIWEVKKGRAIFYPTYFDRLSLEVINPHKRNTKAGSFPIYYEVVPSGSIGILQIIYIPYDAIIVPTNELKDQVKFDCNLLKELIANVFKEIGIGAKTKLGWGRAKVINSKEEKICFHNLEGICDE